jgi:hypothetical protein
MTDSAEVIHLLKQLTDAERLEVFSHLRQVIPIHEMEKTLMAPAETILEAIARSSDLTVRGIEGIIAESAFSVEVVPGLVGWSPVKFYGDVPYDEILTDGNGPEVKVQVKMQRRKNRKPLMASDVWKKRKWPTDHFVVETQKTRSGKDETGANTRPYKFGSFDILAVSLGASKGSWSAFLYTLERWLLPAADDASKILTYQPVSPAPNDCWTDDFLTCVAWLRSGKGGSVEPQ